MKKKAKNVLKHELIGLSAEVVESKNKRNTGIKGKIIDETKNTITISQKNKKKRLIKKNIKIIVKIKNNQYKIDCDKIRKRPEERLKLR